MNKKHKKLHSISSKLSLNTCVFFISYKLQLLIGPLGMQYIPVIGKGKGNVFPLQA
jgi:hypothetical protein